MKLLLWTLCVLVALTTAISVRAATVTVTSISDETDGICDADCTLREAVDNAHAGDTIVFSSMFNTPQTITLSGEIMVTGKVMSIVGPGAHVLTISGGGTNRLFNIEDGSVALSGMTLTGGNGFGWTAGYGGAILVMEAALTLDSVRVTGNSATFGGGVFITSSFNTVIRNSTFSGNSSVQHGSAIASEFSVGTVTITNTTISGNTTPNFSAVVHQGGSEMTIQNCTIVNNSGSANGGIYADSPLRLRSSIVAGNTGTYPELYLDAAQVSGGFNLIGNSAGDAAKTNLAFTYQTTDIRDTDPQLGALGYNVGRTPVHTPTAASPVIDKGSAFGQTTDQRGSARTYDNTSIANAAGGDGTDIGSVELQAALAGEVALTGRVTTALGRPIRGAQIIVQASNGATRRGLTSQFGFYRISGLEAGEAYVITVSAKRHRFTNASHSVTPADNLWGIDFAAQP